MNPTDIDQPTLKRLQARADAANCTVNELLNRWLDDDDSSEPLQPGQMRRIIDHLPMAVAVFDREMRYVQVNDAWRDQYRLGDASIIGENHYEVFPEISDEWKAIHQRCLNGAVDINERAPFPRRDGTLDWIKWEVRPWYLDEAQTVIGGIMMLTQVITQHVELETALRVAAMRYQSLFEQSNDAVFLISLDGTHVDANQRALDMLGYTLEELRTVPKTEVVIAQELAASNDVQERMLAGEKMPLYQRTLKRKDGSTFPAEINVALIYDEDGNVMHIQSIARDISERVETERSLIEKENTLSMALQAAHAGVWVWEFASNRLKWDAGMEAIYGLEPGTFGGTNADWAAFVHPDDREQVMAEVAAGLEADDHISQQFRINRTDGSIRHIQARAIIVRDATTRQIRRVIGINSDFTEQVQMEETLRTSEERYRLLSDLTVEGVALHDGGVIRDVNAAMLKMFGYERDEIIGEQVIDMIFAPESRAIVRENVQKQYLNIYEVTGVRKDGSRFPLEIEARQISPNLRVASLRDLTERRRNEAALRERDLLFKLAFDSSPDAINLSRVSDGLYIDVNQGFCDITGYTREEVVGKTSLQLNIWKQPEVRQRMVDILVSEGFVNDLEAEFRHKSGSIVIGLMSARILTFSGEDIVLSITRDITERKRAEMALRESEEQYRLLAENARDLVYRIRLVPEMRFEYVSPSSTAMVGYTPEEHYDDPHLGFKLVHPDDHHLLQEIAAGHSGKALVLRWIRKDGNIIWAEQKNTPILDDDGNVVAIEGIARDITERKQVEEALRVKESAIASSITAFALADLEGKLTYVNEAFLRLWKLNTESQAVGRSVLEFWQSAEAAQAVVAAINTEDSFVGKLKAHLADGTLADVKLTATMVRNEQGKPICMMGSFIDITAEKQAETFALELERLKAQFRKEQIQNELIQRVISMLSHDLRTSLAVIASSRDLLTHYYDRLSEDKRREKLAIIGRQIQFALELLEDTVNIVRGNLSERQFNPSKINLAALCQVSVDEIRVAQNTQHEITFVNKRDVEIAMIDEVLVSRILLNLLSNAIKYSPDGGEIVLELDQTEDSILLRVRDNGIGISTQDLQYIFDPFYRVKGVNQTSGTGLGLSIVHDCVERHKGRIEVESVPGKGSVFTVQLPAEPIVDSVRT